MNAIQLRERPRGPGLDTDLGLSDLPIPEEREYWSVQTVALADSGYVGSLTRWSALFQSEYDALKGLACAARIEGFVTGHVHTERLTIALDRAKALGRLGVRVKIWDGDSERWTIVAEYRV